MVEHGRVAITCAARLGFRTWLERVAADEADVLTGDLALATFFEAALTAPAAAKSVAKWVLNVVLAAVDDDGSVADLPFTGEALGALVSLVDRGTISTTAGKEVLAHMVATGASDPAAVVADKGLAQVSDESALEAAIDAVMAANPAETERYAGGDKRRDGPLAIVGEVLEVLQLREHQREQNYDDDGAAVDQHLYQGQELREEHQEDAGDAQHGDQQGEGCVDDVACQYHSKGAPNGERPRNIEQDQRGPYHQPPPSWLSG